MIFKILLDNFIFVSNRDEIVHFCNSPGSLIGDDAMIDVISEDVAFCGPFQNDLIVLSVKGL